MSPTVIDKCGQATKGVWWMSWHREATKDVVACDKLREAGKQALIRRFPNEETQCNNLALPATEFIGGKERTQGTETSKYLEEKKETSIP
jgi:hypothetical protein